MPDTFPPLLTPSHRLRRQIVKGAIGTVLGAVAAFFGWTRLLFPPKRTQATLGPISQFKADGPSFVTPPGTDATYIVEKNGDSFHVLDAHCTHQGCIVDWDAPARQFLCPCHAARYDRTGKVVSGPAPSPLEIVDTDVRGDELFITG